jgi:hypothetical protein
MTDDASLDIFERTDGGALVCRVCGCLVPEQGDFPRVHWDWHEASNGA